MSVRDIPVDLVETVAGFEPAIRDLQGREPYRTWLHRLTKSPAAHLGWTLQFNKNSRTLWSPDHPQILHKLRESTS